MSNINLSWKLEVNITLKVRSCWRYKGSNVGFLIQISGCAANEWKMEKTCEFCGAAWAVVYCEADAALLCLSCDTKVHSANALFARHSRTLLCDSCKQKPVYVRCLDHFMLLCQDCDKSFPHHNNLIIRSFTGCPSANQFAALSGFDVLHQFSTATSFITSDTATGFCTQQHKVTWFFSLFC